MNQLIELFNLELKSNVIDLEEVERIVKLHPYSKKKREPSTPQRNAIVDYLEAEHNITIPRNYSQKRIIEFAEEQILEIQREREEKEAETKIITPFDILRGDTSIVEFCPASPNGFSEENAYEWDLHRQEIDAKFKEGLAPRGTRASKLVAQKQDLPHYAKGQVDVNSTPGDMQHPTFLGSSYDIVLPLNFRPKFQLTARTPDGRPCVTLSYVFIDEIIKLGAMWKLNVNKTRYKDELLTLVYWIQTNGEVIVRETLDDNYIVLR